MDYQSILEKQEYGCVQVYGKTIVVAQQPYISESLPFDDTYEAIGIDENFNEYQIKWAIIRPDCEDESDACDWSDYTVRKY